MSEINKNFFQESSCGRYKVSTIVNGILSQNCYVLTHQASKEALVIDPGASMNEIQNVLESEGAKIQHIILTHAHFDHVGSAAELAKRYNVRIHMHDGDKRLLRMASTYALRFEKRNIETPRKYSSLSNEPILWAGDDVRTISTPGHTEGSVCYKIGGICFTGDILIRKIIGNSDLPGADFDQLRKSVSRLFNELSSDVELYPGHGRAWSVAEAKAWWMQVQHREGNDFGIKGKF